MFESQARVSPVTLLNISPSWAKVPSLSAPYGFSVLIDSAPGLVFWFADAEASSATAYPPTTFRWIDNQKEAEEAVDAAKKKAAKRAAGEE
jgi:hypothetical protein